MIGFYLVATKVSTVLGQLLTGLGAWSHGLAVHDRAAAFSWR